MLHCVTTCPQPKFAHVIENLNRELRQKGHLISGGDGETGVHDGVEAVLEQCRAQNRQLISEMRTRNFDVIRFATYRTACKLRFVQKRTNLYLVDIWNMIEAFREVGLSSLDPAAEVPLNILEMLLTCVFCSLNKRLPNSAQIDVADSVQSLFSFLVCAYDVEGRGRLRVMSIKTSLSMMSTGKFIDKLKYAFSLVSDNSGRMMHIRLDMFVQELLILPAAVFESPSFEYSDGIARTLFDQVSHASINDFVDLMTSDSGPPCLTWLSILQRLASVENVYHPVACEACHRESFAGLRYKCQRCYNYNLCQDCFWRGRTSGNHQNDHDVKEYSFYKSPAKQLGEMMRKSMQCVPNKTSSLRLPRTTDNFICDRSVDMKHIIPATPPARHGRTCNSKDGYSSTRRSASLDRPAKHSELTWRAYHIPSANETEPESEAGMVVSIVIGSCLLSLAIVYGIAACLIIPMIMTRRQQRARQAHSLIPEPDDVSVEKESTNWFLSSETDVEAVQELEVAASHTDRYR